MNPNQGSSQEVTEAAENLIPLLCSFRFLLCKSYPCPSVQSVIKNFGAK
jgi:hypothetical protein